MSSTPYRVPHPRGRNAVRADSQTVTSADGLRRVTFRNAKRSIGGGQYDIVRVAQLKELRGGRWAIIESGRSEEAGRAFLKPPAKE